ncbi:P22AR C-terminal domain-containing protein [Pectobacterium versatile]|uniref:P22AR C-terminal domain-containing protein n=1 Tax=Pectobacterium versatile TaxID=2488639 RepID=UPI0021AE8C48|nr:P22AR C-terminal domain-containing protein [Pectobacterium versatile]
MGNIYPDIWKLVHQRFDVEHIHQLPPDQIGEAIEYLDTLEGEYIGKQNSLPANIRLTEKEIIRLAWLWDSSNRSRDLFRQLHPALKDLRSEFSSKAYDHANEFGYIIEETRKIIIGLIDEMPLPSNLWDCDKLVLERIRRNSLPF